MTFEMTDHVPGLSEEQLTHLVDEAKRGFELNADAAGPNPHLLAVPEDLFDAIAERAQRDGEAPEDVVRQALAAYLDIA